MTEKTLPTLILDESLVSTAMKGVQNAFTNLFGVTAKAGKYSIETESRAKGDVSGILGMIQDRVEATLVLTFEKNTIFALLERMYGKPFSEIDHSVRQGVGELTNIIYAGVKKDLNDKGHKFKMSIPSVIIGANHTVYNIHDGKTLVIPFSVDGAGEFFVEITLQSH